MKTNRVRNSLNVKSNNSTLDLITHFFFIVLVLYAIYFMEERLLADSSYYFFRVVNNETLWFEHNRYVLTLSQLLPFIGAKLGLSLSINVLLYSVGHIVFFYSIYFVTRYIYKDSYSGFLLLGIQLLGVTAGFFVPMFELYYAAGLLVLFNTIFTSSTSRFKLIPLLIISFFILTAHLYAFILFVFVLVYSAIERNKFKNRELIPYVALIIFVLILKSQNTSTYEQGKMEAFIRDLVSNTYDFSYLKKLMFFLLENYWELLSLMLINIIVFIFAKKYLNLVSFLLFFIIALVMINVSSYGFEMSRYKEQVYFSLVFLVCFPFVYEVLDKSKSHSKSRVVLVCLITTLFILRLLSIQEQGKYYKGRIVEMNQLIDNSQKKNLKKVFIKENKLKFDANWSYPIESLILSSMHNKEKSVTIATDGDMSHNNNLNKLKNNQFLYRRWEIYGTNTLNKNYFQLENSNYRELK